MERAVKDGTPLFDTRDTVKSMVPSHGDYRIITSKRVVKFDSFIPHPDFEETGTRMAHSLTDYVNSDD